MNLNVGEEVAFEIPDPQWSEAWRGKPAPMIVETGRFVEVVEVDGERLAVIEQTRWVPAKPVTAYDMAYRTSAYLDKVEQAKRHNVPITSIVMDGAQLEAHRAERAEKASHWSPTVPHVHDSRRPRCRYGDLCSDASRAVA